MAYGWGCAAYGFLLDGWIDYAVANFEDSFYKWGRTFFEFLKTTAFKDNLLDVIAITLILFCYGKRLIPFARGTFFSKATISSD